MAVLRASVAHANGTWFSLKRVCISCLDSSLGVIGGSDIVLRTRPKCFARTINSSTREMHQELTIFDAETPLDRTALCTIIRLDREVEPEVV